MSENEVMPAEIVDKATELVRTEEGLAMLEKVLKETFTPEALKKMLLDLCQAEDIKMSKEGAYTTPNWSARRDGLDRVMNVLGYGGKDENSGSGGGGRLPSKIVFNIVQNAPEKK